MKLFLRDQIVRFFENRPTRNPVPSGMIRVGSGVEDELVHRFRMLKLRKAGLPLVLSIETRRVSEGEYVITVALADASGYYETADVAIVRCQGFSSRTPRA